MVSLGGFVSEIVVDVLVMLAEYSTVCGVRILKQRYSPIHIKHTGTPSRLH